MTVEAVACSICGREIVWKALRDGSRVACDPTLRLLSEMPLDAKVAPDLTSLVTDEGVVVKKEFVYPGVEKQGYVPHVYTCDTVADKAVDVVILMDRKWKGDESVGPAKEGEGGFGGGGELE